MKAYKAFDKNLTCRDFQYEIGKTYEMKDEPIICERGFHACTKLDDVFNYYDLGGGTRICEVELVGDIDDMSQKDSKVATNKIKIIRELRASELWDLGTRYSKLQAIVCGCNKVTDEMIQQLHVIDRMIVAEFGANKHRNILVNDMDWIVRQQLSRFGTHKHRDILVHDEDPVVRLGVVKFGTHRHHDILVYDSDPTIRREVAKRGAHKHRDILVHDKNSHVRVEVAKCGNDKHRTQLVNDIDSSVRFNVAVYGNRNLRKQLMDDTDFDVRNVAKHRSRFWVG